MIAALQNDRRAIGIEKEPKWFEVAKARVIEQATSRVPDGMSS
jgi:DNA modification methylase